MVKGKVSQDGVVRRLWQSIPGWCSKKVMAEYPGMVVSYDKVSTNQI